MNSSRYNGLRHFIYAEWPLFASLYGGMVFALLVVGISATQGWFSFIPMATAVLLIFIFFLLATLWSAYQLYDIGGLRPHHVLFDMGQIQANDTFIFIDLGYRRRAINLSRRLTTGRIIVLDIYNPQWTTNPALVRLRKRMPIPPPDPRISLRDASMDLIPLPDESVSSVMLCQIASELWQQGDQLTLLKEVHRVLTPNGRLLLAERTRTQTNWLVMGLMALNLKRREDWEQLLNTAGFVVRRTQDLSGLISCFRADKPSPAEAQQMALDLAFDA
ncbi:MAG: methyltransferase domain-containing protein [Chloroflexi bacterium]|nr:MAG: methyltransferase domain-containing protein [Chloroflexota bacterium]